MRTTRQEVIAVLTHPYSQRMHVWSFSQRRNDRPIFSALCTHQQMTLVLFDRRSGNWYPGNRDVRLRIVTGPEMELRAEKDCREKR